MISTRGLLSVLLITLTVSVGCPLVANAAIPTGYFSNSDSNTRAWIGKDCVTIRKRKTCDTYGLIVNGAIGSKSDDNYQSPTAWIFRIEDLGNGVQAWLQIFQNNQGSLSLDPNGHATFTSQFQKTGSNSYDLRLIPTDFGIKIGCKYEANLKSDSEVSWVPFRVAKDQTLKNKNSNSSFVLLTNGSLSGNFFDKGSFELEHAFHGVRLLRKKSFDPNTVSGASISNDISALGVLLYHQRFILSNYYEVVLLNLRPGVRSCSSIAAIFEE